MVQLLYLEKFTQMMNQDWILLILYFQKSIIIKNPMMLLWSF